MHRAKPKPLCRVSVKRVAFDVFLHRASEPSVRGSFDWSPGSWTDGHVGRLDLYFDAGTADWELLDTIMHETMEISMNEHALTFRPFCRSSCTTNDRKFVMSHSEFDEAMSQAAMAAADIYDNVRRMRDKWRKK